MNRLTIGNNSFIVFFVSTPGPRGFLLILSIFICKFATRSDDRSAEPERFVPSKKIKEAVRVAKFANKE